MPNFITKKWEERKRRINDDKVRETIDRNERSKNYWNAYRKASAEKAKKQAEYDANPPSPSNNKSNGGSSRSSKISRAGNAAQSGMAFLSGEGFGGLGGGNEISNNINNLLDMGFGGSSKPSMPKAKAKVTVIKQGGKTIRITDRDDNGEFIQQHKKGNSTKSYFDNLQDVMDQDLPW